ncbi:MAG: hypothetical protein PHT12_06020 [Patescibacteria group bacterium]|nr:hypothetical protein [Patescibacteria group bacterium]
MSQNWYDRAVYRVDGDDRRRTDILLPAEPIEWYGVVGLKPTALECTIFETARTAVAAECERLGCPRLLPPDDRIHVLNNKEFDAKIGAYDGMSLFRHLYLRRTRLPGPLFADTLHEFGHGVGYLRICAEIPRRRKHICLRPTHRGLLRLRPRQQQNYVGDFEGLDEAVTEIFMARGVQWANRHCGRLDPAVVAGATICIDYLPVLYVAAKLCHVLADDFGGVTEARDALMRDALTGHETFLRQLNQRLPGARRVIAAMTGNRPSALATAERLGFSDIVERIHRFTKP